MDFKIEVKYIDPVRVACTRYKGPMSEAKKNFPNVFKAIKGNACGPEFFAYYEVDEANGISDMELCVPTVESTNNTGIMIKEFPRTKAACLTLIGPYTGLPGAYQAIYQYLEEHKLTVEAPWREIYIKGPGLVIKGNPEKYITEIQFPLKEE